MNIIDTSANAKVTSSYGRFIPRAWAYVSKENQKNDRNRYNLKNFKNYGEDLEELNQIKRK